MAAIDMIRPVTAHAGLTSAFTRAAGTFAAWNDARVTRKALDKLSTRELEDIGLCRGDIEDIAQRTTRF